MKEEAIIVPTSMTPDGSAVACQIRSSKTGWDIVVLPRTAEAKPVPFRATPFNEGNPEFSPDGKFLAYASNESGRNEVYVQSYPGPGRTWQVSTAGGTDVHWRKDGKELYYRGLDQKLMAVEVRGGDPFQVGIPQVLFLGHTAAGAASTKYVPDRTGQKFLFVAPLGRESMTPTTVVLNWFAGLGK